MCSNQESTGRNQARWPLRLNRNVLGLFAFVLGCFLSQEQTVVGQTLLDDQSVQIEQVESSTRQQFAKVAALLEGNEYSDALELIQRLEDAAGDRMVEHPKLLVNQSFPVVRYIPFREYLASERRSWRIRFPEAWKQHVELAGADLPSKIDAYRETPSDDESASWFIRASASEQATEYWTARGDRYLERGWIQAARWCFQNGHLTLRAPISNHQGQPTGFLPWHFIMRKWKPLSTGESSPFLGWFEHEIVSSTPVSNPNRLAGLWARLCWCSLLEGDRWRASLERRMLSEFFPVEKVVESREETGLERVYQ